MDDAARTASARTLIDAITAGDWTLLREQFDEDAVMHAATPSKTRPLQELHGSAALADRMHEWFEDPEAIVLEAATVDNLTDEVTRVTYRMLGKDSNGWWRVDQTAYLEPGDQRFRRVMLSCSGFGDVPEPLISGQQALGGSPQS